MPKLTRTGYIAAAGIGAALLVVGGKYATNFLGKPVDIKAIVPQATSIQHFTVTNSAPAYNLPATATRNTVTGCPVLEELAWQATGGLDVANGGALSTGDMTTDVGKYTGGGCLQIKRQDDYSPMEANLAKFVNTNGAEGDAFFVIMGDAYPYVAAALNKIIPGQFAAIDAIGLSDGEDKCMLPADWREQMKAGTPILIAAVPRDGDWNVCVKFASDNDIKINVDQKTVDPSAFNFVDVDSFTSADDKLVAGYCENRSIVTNGLAHSAKKVCVNGVATWTPGDVDVVQKYPGSIVGVASTHDYAGQMPALLIGVKSWMDAHPDYVTGLIKAADRGAEAIRTSPTGLYTMGQVHTQIFGEQTPDYWVKYFKGVDATDQKGNPVHLGGSKVITLTETRDYFGLRPGTDNVYASVYRVFKGYDEFFYPNLYPKVGSNAIPAYDDVVDLKYLNAAIKDIPAAPVNQVVASIANITTAAPITQKVSTKSWHIEFDTGKATIKPESEDVLFQIEDTAAMTGLRIRVDGYTDNTGSNARNIPLSGARAQAVAGWLTTKAPANFPVSRFEVRGHGSLSPVCAGNATADCRAQNRRVEITLGS